MAASDTQQLRVLYEDPTTSVPTYYVSRPSESEGMRCNYCDLMPRCYELYGVNGARCPIVSKQQIWLRLAEGIVCDIKGEDLNR